MLSEKLIKLVALIAFISFMLQLTGCASMTPLTKAAKKGDVAMINKLLDEGAKIDEPNLNGQKLSSLGWSLYACKFDAAELLLRRGANINSADSSGFTYLHQAVYYCHGEKKLSSFLEHLIQQGANVNAHDTQGATPLMYAVQYNYLPIAEFLLARGADVNAHDKRGATPLIYAVQNYNLPIAALLLTKGADVNASDNQGDTPLIYAVQNNDLPMAEFLLARGADVNAHDKRGDTPLIYAVQNNYLPIAALLLTKGADVNAHDKRGDTLLLYAVQHNDLPVAELLLTKGADVNAHDKQGVTPLLYAVQYNDLPMAKLLLARGADVNIEDANKKNAMSYAEGKIIQPTNPMIAQPTNQIINDFYINRNKLVQLLQNADSVRKEYLAKVQTNKSQTNIASEQKQPNNVIAKADTKPLKEVKSQTPNQAIASQQKQPNNVTTKTDTEPPKEVKSQTPNQAIASQQKQPNNVTTKTDTEPPKEVKSQTPNQAIASQQKQPNNVTTKTDTEPPKEVKSQTPNQAIASQQKQPNNVIAKADTEPPKEVNSQAPNKVVTNQQKQPNKVIATTDEESKRFIPDSSFGRYFALIIGNNRYSYLPKLRTAINDAEIVASILKNNYGFNVTVLQDARRSDILIAMGKLREKLSPKDNLLIYYAGHGWLDKDEDEGYWLPVDATKDNEINWISNEYVTKQLKAMAAKSVLIVADSCYSGKLGRGIHIQKRSPDYYSRVSRRRGRSVISSGGLEPVIDSGGMNGDHSVFASAFIEALQENKDIIDATELFTIIRRPVVLNADQTPEYADIRKAGHDGGEFIFIRTK